METKTTIKELARSLNLSTGTISKALNGSREISEKTRKRVKEAAISKNYSPNYIARCLRAKKTRTIGVIVPNVLHNFFAKAIHGIEATVNKYDYKIVVCLSNEAVKKEAESLHKLINSKVDGVIVSLSKETEESKEYSHFLETKRHDLPVVLFDRITNKISCDSVSIDNAAAAKEATKELLSSGCKNIIFLSTIHGTSVERKRELGYKEALLEVGKKPQSVYISNYSQFEEVLLKVLNTTKTDAILAADELSAISVLKYAIRNNVKIPQDLSVVGFSNGILAENYTPSLTTVEQHAEEQGAMAAEILINRIENQLSEEMVQKVLEATIIHRESTYNTKVRSTEFC